MDKGQLEVTRRGALQGGAGLTALWALAACSAGGGGSKPGNAPSLGSKTDDFLKTVGPQLGTKSISLLAYAAPQAEAIKALTGQFTELTGITVDWTGLDEQSAVNKASVALGAGSGGYDVVHTTSGLLPTYVSRGWLSSMSQLQQSSKATIPAWDAAVYGKGTTDLLSFADALYAAPSFLGTQIFYYRTDVFKAKGVTKLPSTLAELRGVCEKVHGNGMSAIALRSAPSPSQLMFVWTSWLYAFGGSYYQSVANGTYDGVALNTPKAVASLELYCDLLQNYAPTGATNWSVEDVSRSFTTGQVAIVQEGAVFGSTFNDKAKSQAAGKVGTFIIPAGDAGRFVPYNAHGWGIAASSKRQDAAWLFTQWATLQQTLTAATTGTISFSTPPLASVYETPEYKAKYGFDDFIHSVTSTIAAANNGGVTPVEGDASYLPATPKWNTLGQRISEELSKAVTGQASPRAAIAAAAAAMSAQ